MTPGIQFTKIWSDDDLIELRIDSSDGASLFANKAYVAPDFLNGLVVDLSEFKDKTHGGIYDIRCGEFGPEYAGGAFLARLHFADRCKLYITVRAQSDYENFGIKNVSSEATLYITSEPGLFDAFIAELEAMKLGTKARAMLEGITPRPNR